MSFGKSLVSAGRVGAALVAVLSTIGCVEKAGDVHVKVEAKTNQGDPVSAAEVSLDGKAIGKTDNQGAFAADLSLPVGTKPKLEVKKESDAYYFAPYYESFVVAEGAQDVGVAATLYFVPKPGPEGGNIKVTAEPPPAQAASTTEVVTAPPPADGTAAAPTAEVTAVTQIEPVVPPPAAAEVAPPPPAEEPVAAKEVPVVAENVSGPVESDLTNVLETPAEPVAEVQPEAPAEPVAEVQPVQDDAADSNGVAKPAPFPATQRANHGPTLVTVYVVAGETPIPEAEVFLGEEDGTDLKNACTTNARGRCVVRFPEKPTAAVTFVASKKGYKTASISALVKDKGKLRISLEHGHTLDIFALSKAYNHSVGMKDVEVYVGGQKVGVTDRFGRYSYVHQGKADDLLSISLKPKSFLPEAYETDFVTSGPMTLVKYFTPEQPPAVRLTVLAPVPAGSLSKKATEDLNSAFDDNLRASARKHLFSSAAFKEFSLPLYEKALKRTGRSTTDMLKAGWQETDLKASVDALLIPTVVAGTKPTLELSVVDSTGRVLAAAKEDLDTLGDKTSVDRAVAVLAKKITRAFPFEGAVLSKEADKVVINLGHTHGRGLKSGDVIDVFGVQAEKLGRSQLYKKVATLVVREVLDSTAKCSVTKVLPRATVERGDLVALRPRKAPEGGGAQIRVVGGTKTKATPVSQANVYFNDIWIGATDEAGRLYLDATGSGTMRIIKQGFEDYAKPVTVSTQSKLEASLKRESAYLRIDSKPSGVAVKVDGKEFGKTPLAAPIPVPTGFVKLELVSPTGFKPYSQVLEFDQGTLDLTGNNAIALEQDYRAQADKLLKAGRNEDALALLNQIPKEHSDYLLGRHEAGEIYLTLLDQPAKAAEAFGLVTANEAVKQFADKRFIGSHINEGIALFMTAERLAPSQPEAAKAHYQKALEVLDNVVPHLRFVPADQYAAAVHNVDYHRALCRHRIWAATQDPRLLAETVKTWRSYLDGSARSVPADGNSKTYVENAEVYYKQATASLNANKSVSKQ